MSDYTAIWNRVAVNGWAHTIRELVAAHDVQRRELQAENTRLVEENRDLRAERDAAVKLAEGRRGQLVRVKLSDIPRRRPNVDLSHTIEFDDGMDDDEPTTPDYSVLGDGAWFDFPGNER